MHFFVTAAKGTEPALRDELRASGLAGVRCDRGGVHVAGDWPDGWRACLAARSGLSVLLELGAWDAPTSEEMYSAARAVDWTPFLTPARTFAVSATCHDSKTRHSGYLALKIKDAVADAFRDHGGIRPNVDRENPDLEIFARLLRNRLTLFVNLNGVSLHRRGYRTAAGAAPLRENMAAAVLQLAGYDGSAPFVDPLCGSGTLAIEAALIAARLAPGLLRENFAFEKWPAHDAVAHRRMKELRAELRGLIRDLPADVLGRDRDGGVLRAARDNAQRAGVPVRFESGPLKDFRPAAPRGFIVCNPPYGERLARPTALYRDLRELLFRAPGWTAAILTADPNLPREMHLRPKKVHHLFNGPIPCYLYAFDLA